MALARIITRSQACSRELALDLLARGYAVEIVSPDAIPDNLADLELRVEEDPGNQLVASVTTHNGERSASLDFVHCLKTPMPDFVRRPPEPQEVAQLEQSVNFIAEPKADAVELRGEASQTRCENGIAAAEPLLNFEPAELMNSVLAHSKSSALEIPGYFPVEDPVIASASIDDIPVTHPRSSSGLDSLRSRSAGWRWRAALMFASVVSLALVLAYGLRRSGNASAQSAATSDEKVASATASSNLFIPPNAVANAGQIPPTARSVMKDARTPTVGAKSALSTKPSAASKVPRGREEDLVAHDTVTYLDKGFAPHAVAKSGGKSNPVKRVARKLSRRHKHRDEVIAASKVTYLDKAAPKVAK